MLVLAGSGQTRLWTDDGREAVVDWTAGDLISPPFQVWRSHRNTGSEPARFLRFQNNFIELALGVRGRSISLDGAGLPGPLPRGHRGGSFHVRVQGQGRGLTATASAGGTPRHG